MCTLLGRGRCLAEDKQVDSSEPGHKLGRWKEGWIAANIPGTFVEPMNGIAMHRGLASGYHHCGYIGICLLFSHRRNNR